MALDDPNIHQPLASYAAAASTSGPLQGPLQVAQFVGRPQPPAAVSIAQQPQLQQQQQQQQQATNVAAQLHQEVPACNVCKFKSLDSLPMLQHLAVCIAVSK